MKWAVNEAAFDCLEQVLTVREVSYGWCVHHSTVIYHCLTGTLAARKAGGTWLVYRESVLAWFGEQRNSLEKMT